MATKKATKKAGAKHEVQKRAGVKLPKFSVARSGKTGVLIINGTSASQLINKYPDVKIKKASVKPKNLSDKAISEMIRSMKVA